MKRSTLSGSTCHMREFSLGSHHSKVAISMETLPVRLIAPWITLFPPEVHKLVGNFVPSVPQWPYWSIFQVTSFRLWEKLDNFSSSLRFVMRCVYSLHHLAYTVISNSSPAAN